jgi:hypothetical protein
VGKSEVSIESTVGVKQGDTLAPILFLFVMQAAMETLEPIFVECGIEKPAFLTTEDDVISGRKVGTAGEIFHLWAALYADDAGLLFSSRADLERGARLLKQHLARFGLVMHCGSLHADGSIAKKSKTEAVFYPPVGYSPTCDDTLPLRVDDALGIVTFTDRFRYLGAISSSSLTDDEEVAQRIHSATAAFGSLRKWVFGQNFGSRSLPLASKGKIYQSLVLGILLYGCESWILTAQLRQQLNAFHNRCVRTMAQVHTRGHSNCLHRASLEPMYAALGLTSIDQYISSRKLRWAGHVMRMSMSRLPRKFITSWVDAPRARGRAHFYGHDLTHELRAAGFNLDRQAARIGVSRSWVETAQHRDIWRELVKPVLSKPVSRQGLTVARSSRSVVDALPLTEQPDAARWTARLRIRR